MHAAGRLSDGVVDAKYVSREAKVIISREESRAKAEVAQSYDFPNSTLRLRIEKRWQSEIAIIGRQGAVQACQPCETEAGAPNGNNRII